LLLPIFAAMTAGAQIAGEARAGTLRMMLTRPRSRVSVFLSKSHLTQSCDFCLSPTATNNIA
jgi:hypothetical protein